MNAAERASEENESAVRTSKRMDERVVLTFRFLAALTHCVPLNPTCHFDVNDFYIQGQVQANDTQSDPTHEW